MNASKTLSELSNTEIKVPGIKCQVYLGVIGIKMMGNIETGNYMTEGGSVKSEKQWTQDRTLRDPIRKWEIKINPLQMMLQLLGNELSDIKNCIFSVVFSINCRSMFSKKLNTHSAWHVCFQPAESLDSDLFPFIFVVLVHLYDAV